MLAQKLAFFLDVVWRLLKEVIPIISPLITILLTGVLVYLYGQQSDILDRQRELSESEQRALPRVLTYRLFSWRTLYRYAQHEEEIPDIPSYPERFALFFAYISNPGKGFADDLYAELRIDSGSYSFSSSHPLVTGTNTDQLLFSEQGGVIAPEENEIAMYQSAFWFTENSLPDALLESDISYHAELTPSELLWILEDMDESPVEIGIFLHYRDGTGIREPIQLLTSKVDLDSYEDLTEAWRRGDRPSGNMEPIFSLHDSEDAESR